MMSGLRWPRGRSALVEELLAWSADVPGLDCAASGFWFVALLSVDRLSPGFWLVGLLS